MLVMMLVIELASAGGGDMGGGGTWNGLDGSVPCLCPYMLKLLVGFKTGLEDEIGGLVGRYEIDAGLAVRVLGGGGGNTLGLEFEVGLG